MNYGFTPGAGATYIVGERMGQDVGRESLLTGEGYAGRELRERGVKLGIMPRAEVNEAAMMLAKQMAQGGRGRLVGLKQQLRGKVQERLEETYRLELAMHEKTFVGRSDTLAQIEKNFYQETEAWSAGVRVCQFDAEPEDPTVDSTVLQGITASL